MVEIDHGARTARCLDHDPCTSHCVPRMGYELVALERSMREHPHRHADLVADQFGRPVRRAAEALLEGAGSEFFEGAAR